MRVLIYPRGDNPYQELLYQELRKIPGDTFTYIDPTSLNIIFFPFMLAIKRAQGYKILHIHWLAFQTDILNFWGKQLSLILTFWSLTWTKILGYKVVWTVHNVVPHESLTSNDKAVARYLAKIAAAKIVHSSNTIEQMLEYDVGVRNTAIIPHGNYIGVYPNSITKAQARNQLNVKKVEFVILFFGLIRSYKGIDDLLEAFEKINIPDTRLIIVGKCDDEAVRDNIIVAKKTINIDIYEGRVKNKDVSMYFQACDVVCLPFKAITTSGSALLALSLGKPIIAPYLGALRDLPKNVGYLYDANKPDALEKSLRQAIEQKAKLNNMGEAGKKYSETLTWDKVAEQTYRLYEKVINRPIKGES